MTLLSYFLAHPAWKGSVVAMKGKWACITHPSGAVCTLPDAFKNIPSDRLVRIAISDYTKRGTGLLVDNNHPLMRAYFDELETVMP